MALVVKWEEEVDVTQCLLSFLFWLCCRYLSLWYRDLSLVATQGLCRFCHAGCLVVAYRLSTLWQAGSAAGAQAYLPHHMWDLSSLTRDWTQVLCIGRQILNHWTHHGSLWTKWFLGSLMILRILRILYDLFMILYDPVTISLWSVYDPVITNGGTTRRSILIYRDRQITSNLNETSRV